MVVAFSIAERLVCHCYGVSESQMHEAIEQLDAQTVEQVTSQHCAGNGCTACHFRIQRLINKSRVRVQCA